MLLGGLVARYAIGLLFSKGYFERIEPVVCVSPLLRSGEVPLTGDRIFVHLQHRILVLGRRSLGGIITSGSSQSPLPNVLSLSDQLLGTSSVLVHSLRLAVSCLR